MIKYPLSRDNHRKHGFMLRQTRSYFAESKKIKALRKYYAQKYLAKVVDEENAKNLPDEKIKSSYV